MKIHVNKLSKKFGSYQALKDVSLNIESGEFLALLGPSGSGKTTLLRIIAGLEIEDEGSIDMEITQRKGEVGFVFQHYALFRHMTVFENVAFGLRVRPYHKRKSEQEIRKRVYELLELVHLKGLEWQYPSQLSGGQRQRVALARVLAIEPKVMLLDEPFGALDSKVRKELRRWLRRIHDEMKITTVFVTHDQEEAMEIADRIAILDKGKLIQIGTPEEIWSAPANSFVYDFLGHYNEFLGWQDETGTLQLCDDELLKQIRHSKKPTQEKRLNTFWTRFCAFFGIQKEEKKVSEVVPDYPQRNYVPVFVRPYEIRLDKIQPEQKTAIPAKVVHVNPAGPLIKVELERTDGQLIQAEITQEVRDLLSIHKNDLLWVSPKNFKIYAN